MKKGWKEGRREEEDLIISQKVYVKREVGNESLSSRFRP